MPPVGFYSAASNGPWTRLDTWICLKASPAQVSELEATALVLHRSVTGSCNTEGGPPDAVRWSVGLPRAATPEPAEVF